MQNELNEQWKEWQEMDKKSFELAKSKSKDYSPSNILGLGLPGIIFIMLSKVIRLCNLVGIDLDVKFKGIKQPEEPNNESIEDNLIDIRNYGQIAVIHEKGKWGK